MFTEENSTTETDKVQAREALRYENRS